MPTLRQRAFLPVVFALILSMTLGAQTVMNAQAGANGQAVTNAQAAALPNDALPVLGAIDSRISLSTEKTLLVKTASLYMICSLWGAELWIDRAYVCKLASPYDGQIAAGSHYIEVRAPGYYPLGAWLMLDEKTRYTMRFSPTRITGFLEVETQPDDASISVDGSDIGSGLTELPVGQHRVKARRFGFVEREASVLIQERTATKLVFVLEKAEFSIQGASLSRSAFNPGNAGAAGQVELRFSASSYGSARARVLAKDGSELATIDFPSIETWSQSRSWDGRDSSGAILPDGLYEIELRATPAQGIALAADPSSRDGSILRILELRIDSSLVVRSSGTVSALPGLLHSPDPLAPPGGTICAEASWFAPFAALSSSAFGLSASMSIEGAVVLAVGAAAETGSSSSGADLALSGLVPFFGDRTSALSGAFFLRGAYASASSPSLPGSRSGVEASLPLAAELLSIGQSELKLSLSPGLLADLSGSGPSYEALARSGFWLEGRAYKLGLSGELPFSFSGFSPLWPAELAAEGRLLLGSSPFVVAAYATASLSPSAAPSLGFGIGFGLLF